MEAVLANLEELQDYIAHQLVDKVNQLVDKVNQQVNMEPQLINPLLLINQGQLIKVVPIKVVKVVHHRVEQLNKDKDPHLHLDFLAISNTKSHEKKIFDNYEIYF